MVKNAMESMYITITINLLTAPVSTSYNNSTHIQLVVALKPGKK